MTPATKKSLKKEHELFMTFNKAPQLLETASFKEEPIEGTTRETQDTSAKEKNGNKKDLKFPESDGNGDDKNDEDFREEEEKDKVGMIAEPKNLYQHIDRYNKPFWSDKLPDDLNEAAENEETQKYAVLVRYKRSYDSRKSLEIDSVVVQSPLVKNLLQDVLDGYPGVTTTLHRLSFAAPFRPFVHRWAHFVQAVADTNKYDEETRKHTKILLNVLQEELKDVIAALTDYVKNKVISFEHVWTIFVPETIIYSTRFGHPIALKLIESAYIDHPKLGHCFMMQCACVDYDGYKFGTTRLMQPITPFGGILSITTLDSYPLSFHPDEERVRALLLERGHRFENLAGMHYKSYNGNAIEIDPNCENSIQLVNCEGRIVVDGNTYCKINPAHKPSLKPLNKVGVDLRIHADDEDGSSYDRRFSNPFEFDHYSNQIEEMFLVAEEISGVTADGVAAHIAPLTDEERVLCSPVVRGFSLKMKKWLHYFVDQVRDIQFNDGAFESLVLPPGHKSLILAFTQSQVMHKSSFDDLIPGKGKGIIMLLSGSPGIGKTLTAESVAEVMRVPLYTMGSGDMGTSIWEVENKLQRTLELVAKWNAILLLDECDVFLEKRSTHDLDRNNIVSIFLRTLEYYEGIMFLTTNRVNNIDPAFDSRIHISLEYPNLDESARRAVWKGFLNRSILSSTKAEGEEDEKSAATAAPHTVTEDQITELAKFDLNGRIIKNILKTSNLLAAHWKQPLSYEHLQMVLTVGGHNKRKKQLASPSLAASELSDTNESASTV